MSRRDALKGFFAEAQRLTERAANLKTEMAALRDAATKNGFDWSQIKALASAVTADEEAGDGKRLEKLLSKADFAAAYADMLGLRQNERKVETRSSESSGSDKATNHRPNRQGKTAPPTAPMVGADLGNGSGVDPDEQITESAVPLPDTTPRDGGAAAPAATRGKSTAAAEGALNSPQPDGAPSTNSAIETAALSSPHLNGRIEPENNPGLPAVSTLPDDGIDIPLSCRRNSDGSLVLQVGA